MVRAVVGANWGDEGKGKITDMLGQESDIIVRFQGGCKHPPGLLHRGAKRGRILMVSYI